MDVDVLGYISALKQGDIERAAKISFDCIQCGLCASRCMGEIPQYHAAQLARRVYGRYVLPNAEHLKTRVEAIEGGRYDETLTELEGMSKEELEKRYVEREREPDFAEVGSWKPEETRYL
jgi:ferredoxin